MKKMIKLSLVAAVAVAGLTTTSSAKSLEDAIKGVDVSGMIRYREQTKNLDKGATTENQETKLKLTTKSKVNDNITATVNFTAVNSQDDSVNTNSASFDAANFTYKNGGLTVITGLQDLATPWTDASDGARANGVLALQQVGPVTVAGAVFRDSKMGGDKNAAIDNNNLSAIAALGKAGPVSYQAWYLAIGNGDAASALPKGGDAVALLASANVGPAKIDASYASLEGDENSLPKQTLVKAIVTAKAGPATVVVGAAKGGSDGDLVTFDSDAKVGFESWNIRAGKGGQNNLSAYTAAVVMPVSVVNLKAQYTSASYDTATVNGVDVSEALVQASYKMSKNFGGYLRYAIVDVNNAGGNGDFARTRLEIKYTF